MLQILVPCGFGRVQRSLLVALCLQLTMMACVPAKTVPPRYYKTASFEGIGGECEQVDFDLRVEKPRAKSAPTALVLPERAQAALIAAYAGDDKLRSQLPTILSKKLTQLTTSAPSLTSFTRTFTFTIVALNFPPADRVYAATIRATLPDGWRFTGWNGFEVKDRSVKVATLERTLANKLSGTLGLNPPQVAEVIDSSLGFERSTTDKSTRDLEVEVVDFLPRLKDATADLFLQAPFQQINVAGRYAVDVSFEYAEPDVQPVVDFDLDGEKLVKAKRSLVSFVPIDDSGSFPWELPGVPAVLTMDYTARKVETVSTGQTGCPQTGTTGAGSPAPGPNRLRSCVNCSGKILDHGASTIDEGDDDAVYATRRNVSHPSVELVGGDDLEAEVVLAWYGTKPVQFRDNREDTRQTDELENCLIFGSPEKAIAWRRWVLADPEKRVLSAAKIQRNGRLEPEWQLFLKEGRDFEELHIDRNHPEALQLTPYILNRAEDRHKLVELHCRQPTESE